MEADWDELSRIPVPPPSAHGLPTIATTVAFDDLMELLWTGNEFVSETRSFGAKSDGDRANRILICLIRADFRRSLDQICSAIPPFVPTLSRMAACGRSYFINAV